MQAQSGSGYRVVILGGGSFATAMGNIAADNGCDVSLWLRDQEVADNINEYNINSRYLANYPLNRHLKATTEEPGKLVRDADVILIAVPSKAFLDVLKQIKGHIHDDHIIISCTKGIYADGFLLMSQLISRETGCRNIGALSGPNLAKEILQREVTGVVIASSQTHVRKTVQNMLSCDYFRVYANEDLYGVELAGALKNIYAIASGMAGAMGSGENTRAMLITRSLAEMGRFAKQMGGKLLTFQGLAGVGDLIVTCSTPLSRNYRVGYQIANGVSVQDAINNLGQVAEGINTVKTVHEKAQELNIDMPIVEALYDVLFNKMPIREALVRLLAFDHNIENELFNPQF
ncbi:MAG: NAD(P)H-dependent glycerol-3-phosphate dehydrogenase [Pseudomonadota bacterium]|nr:NAD(P)H-dependent glycerol-3-phosphate dehydrogenase [Pseudomonadota bacterium]